MKVAFADIETDSLNATVIHCIVVQPSWSRKKLLFTNLTEDENEKTRFWLLCQQVDTWVFHNGIGFDVPTINRLLGEYIKPERVMDTLVLSRLIDYNIQDGHSLRAWGIRLGLHKGDFKDFSALSDEMIEYCANDVDVTQRLYKKFLPVIQDPEWEIAIKTEHDIAWVCEEMHQTGFLFDVSPAVEMLNEMETYMIDLEEEFQRIWPPKLVEVNRIKFRIKKDGTLFGNVSKALDKYPKTERVAGELVCYDYKKFEPSSPKQRIERLWEAGWEPVEKTKGHIQYEREQSNGAFPRHSSRHRQR